MDVAEEMGEGGLSRGYEVGAESRGPIEEGEEEEARGFPFSISTLTSISLEGFSEGT